MGIWTKVPDALFDPEAERCIEAMVGLTFKPKVKLFDSSCWVSPLSSNLILTIGWSILGGLYQGLEVGNSVGGCALDPGVAQ